jgi:hypothetical protein
MLGLAGYERDSGHGVRIPECLARSSFVSCCGGAWANKDERDRARQSERRLKAPTVPDLFDREGALRWQVPGQTLNLWPNQKYIPGNLEVFGRLEAGRSFPSTQDAPGGPSFPACRTKKGRLGGDQGWGPRQDLLDQTKGPAAHDLAIWRFGDLAIWRFGDLAMNGDWTIWIPLIHRPLTSRPPL